MIPKRISGCMQLSFGAASDIGRYRDHNEDSCQLDPEHNFFILADGLGGHQAGEVASALAVSIICDYMKRLPEEEEILPDLILRTALHEAHQLIIQKAKEDPLLAGMGTTVVAAWLPPGNGMWVAHVGDSRAYLWRKGVLECITEDHTVFHQMYLAGQLPKDRKRWPPRQLLSQCLGVRNLIAPAIDKILLQKGDRILLCSDGLTDMLPDEEISLLMAVNTNLQEICEKLVQSANDHGGLDNITVIIVQVEEGGAADGNHYSC